MKFENTDVFNFKGAFRGLRNPLESWSKSDSYFGIINIDYDDYLLDNVVDTWVDYQLSRTESNNETIEKYSQEWYDLWETKWDWLYNLGAWVDNNNDVVQIRAIGPKDLDLAHRMINAGSSDRKFLRQIFVSVDITGPLYWWKEFDTYKIGTVANSTSTMHKLASTPITLQNFEIDDYEPRLQLIDPAYLDVRVNNFINDLEQLRQLYLETKDKKYWKELIRWLPNGWLQTRTVTLNYQILRNIYSQRRYHKLTEWHDFCNWIKSLPYSSELIIYGIDK